MSSALHLIRAATVAAFSAASFSAVTAFAAPVTAPAWDAQHDEVRCEAGSNKCVVLQCAGIDFPCVVAREFTRDKTGAWMKPYGFHAAHAARRGEQWTWYGNLHVTCNTHGDGCRELEY